MRRLPRLVADFAGLWRICGPRVAVAWLIKGGLNIGRILEQGDLQAADIAMGDGPFEVRIKRYGCAFRVRGPRIVSGIREMYVRDVYLRRGWLGIQANDVVVDLGANMGNFANLALASHPTVRVVAVEPSATLNKAFNESIGLNTGFPERAQLIRGFVGQLDPELREQLAADPAYADAEWLDEGQLIERAGLHRIDFLKCDIEGGEFALLKRGSRLLAMTHALACEVHSFAGDPSRFIAEIQSDGFVIGPVQRDPDGTLTFLAKRGVLPRSEFGPCAE